MCHEKVAIVFFSALGLIFTKLIQFLIETSQHTAQEDGNLLIKDELD